MDGGSVKNTKKERRRSRSKKKQTRFLRALLFNTLDEVIKCREVGVHLLQSLVATGKHNSTSSINNNSSTSGAAAATTTANTSTTTTTVTSVQRLAETEGLHAALQSLWQWLGYEVRHRAGFLELLLRAYPCEDDDNDDDNDADHDNDDHGVSADEVKEQDDDGATTAVVGTERRRRNRGSAAGNQQQRKRVIIALLCLAWGVHDQHDGLVPMQNRLSADAVSGCGGMCAFCVSAYGWCVFVRISCVCMSW